MSTHSLDCRIVKEYLSGRIILPKDVPQCTCGADLGTPCPILPPTDTQILDFLADERIFDGYGDVDIDEATTQALINSGADPDNEDVWDRESKLEWRRQFRIAIMRQMARNSP